VAAETVGGGAQDLRPAGFGTVELGGRA